MALHKGNMIMIDLIHLKRYCRYCGKQIDFNPFEDGIIFDGKTYCCFECFVKKWNLQDQLKD